MGMEAVVFFPEPFGFQVYLFDIPEQVGIQYVLPVCAVEPLNVSVLVGLAGLDVFYLDILDLTIVDKDP